MLRVASPRSFKMCYETGLWLGSYGSRPQSSSAPSPQDRTPMLRPPLLAVFAALASPALRPAPIAPQGRAERGAFVARLGSDTLAVESFTRSAARLESDLAVRVPRPRLLHYSPTLNPDGPIAKLVITGRPVGNGRDQLPPLDAT